MSAFLGPIHFWLYYKIGRQEELTKTIAGFAEQKGWIGDQTKYTKDLPALEEVIDPCYLDMLFCVLPVMDSSLDAPRVYPKF